MGQNISGRRHSAPKVVGAIDLYRSNDLLQAIQIAGWLRCKRVILHVKSVHFYYWVRPYSILHVGGVSSRKRERFAQEYSEWPGPGNFDGTPTRGITS